MCTCVSGEVCCQNTPTESTNSAVIEAGLENKQKRNSRTARADSLPILTPEKLLCLRMIVQKEVSKTAQPKAARSLDYFRLNTLQ